MYRKTERTSGGVSPGRSRSDDITFRRWPWRSRASRKTRGTATARHLRTDRQRPDGVAWPPVDGARSRGGYATRAAREHGPGSRSRRGHGVRVRTAYGPRPGPGRVAGGRGRRDGGRASVAGRPTRRAVRPRPRGTRPR